MSLFKKITEKKMLSLQTCLECGGSLTVPEDLLADDMWLRRRRHLTGVSQHRVAQELSL